VADGVVALMSLYIDEFLATGEVPGPRHNILTVGTRVTDVYRCADDGWIAVGAIEPNFYANLCRALGCEQWLARNQTDDAAQDAIRADFAAAFANRTRDEWVAHLGPADTCVSEVASGARARAGLALPCPSRARRGDRGGAGDLRAGRMGVSRVWTARNPDPWWRDATVTDTDALLQEVGYSARRSRPYAKRSCRVSDLPPEVEKLIDAVQYEEAGSSRFERGYVYTSCSSVENGNPLFWDDAVAQEVTGVPSRRRR